MAYEYDPQFEQHPAVLASESTDYSAGPISRMADAATKGVYAAAVSGTLSIYNTFADSDNELQAADVLRQLGDTATADYYTSNKDAIDLAGFVGTSLIPGAGGVKLLKLARGGEALGAFGRALALPSSRKAYYMEQALKEVGESGGLVAGILSKTRRSQLLWETADQALTASAAELAIAATMNDSPVFDGQSYKDFGVNVVIGTVFGGAVGGALASIEAKGILKAAQKEIEFSKRTIDTVFDPQKLGLTKGTEVLLFAESIAKLPDDFVNTPFSYRFDGKLVKVEGGLPTAGAFRTAKDRAETLANQQLALKFNELAGGDEVFGQAYFDFIKRGISAARAAGKDADEVVGLLNGYMNNLRKVGPIDPERMALDAKKFYVNMEPTDITDIFLPKRTDKSSKLAYYLEDGVTSADLHVEQFGTLGFTDLKSLWRSSNAPDVVLMQGGRAAINPRSSKISKLLENPTRVRMYMDLETGTLDESAILHFGDNLRGGKLINGDASVEAGGKVFTQEASRAFDSKLSAVDAGARFVWASKFSPTQLLRVSGGTIDATDLPLMSRLKELVASGDMSADFLSRFKVKDSSGISQATDILDLGKQLEINKHALLEEALRLNGPSDARHLAAHLNESVDWVEQSIANNFTPGIASMDVIPRLNTVDALRPRNVQLEWEFSAVKNKMLPEEAYKLQFGANFQSTVELTRQYQLATRSLVQDTAVNSAVGSEAADMLTMGAEVRSRDTSQSGAGSSIFGASNAGYEERAKAGVQNLGKNVALLSQKGRDAAVLALSPHINAVRTSPTAAAELGILTTALRKSENRYGFEAAIAGEQRLLSKPLMDVMASEKVDADTALAMLKATEKVPPRVPHILTVNSEEVANFIRAHTKLNDVRQGRFTPLYNAMGVVNQAGDAGLVYVPPINTVKYPYHAFVRTKEKIGLASETTMLTARNDAHLRELVAKVDSERYDVFFKKDTENYFKAKGEYDYSMTLNEARINSDLERSGSLTDFFPETKAENVLTDYLEFHAKQEEKLVRTAAQVKNRQFFSELSFLSENYRTVSESVTRGIGSQFKSKVADPFGDYIKTGLNISKQQEFPLLDSLNEFVDKLGVRAGEAMNQTWEQVRNKDLPGPKPWEVADSIAQRYGLGTPYALSSDAVQAFMATNSSFPRNLIRESFQKANMLLANFTLRLDFANSLVNILSTPIMIATEVSSLRKLAKGDSELQRTVESLFSVKVPGQQIEVPSTTKLIGGAIKMFFEDGQAGAARAARYTKLGVMKDVTNIYREVLDDLSFDALQDAKSWYNRTNSAVDKMSKFTGNQFSEDFTRFVSAAVMEQITTPLVAAGKMSAREADGFMSIFVNRVQGNYITSQRPVVFQGTTGAAVSLFQTYAFNVLQQLHRHVEAGDKKTLAVFAGMQSTVFGFNGLPFFDAVNTHLIGSMLAGNAGHKDAYEAIPAFNKELGDWMLYGTASAFPLFDGSFAPALYTRGDINPRHISILPTNPLDIPAVSAGIRLATTVYDFGKNVANGVNLGPAMLQGLEHQGINRPLAGFAQLLAGRSTTSQGTLISAANDMQATSWLGGLAERTIEYGGVSRLMGARPMDEAVALNTLYRSKTYDALDRARISNLGGVVKSKLYGGEAPTQVEVEEFMQKYAAAGGRIENFNKSMLRWTRDANVSLVNQMANKLNSSAARKLKVVMGGEELPDYSNGNLPEPSIGDAVE